MSIKKSEINDMDLNMEYDWDFIVRLTCNYLKMKIGLLLINSIKEKYENVIAFILKIIE